MKKMYNCKICGKAFSSGRVLGGHVRSHAAAASLAARNMKSPVFIEKSESDSRLTDGASDDGCGRDLGKSPRNSMETFGAGEKKIGSWSCENFCGVCQKGFDSTRALFGHMRVHSSSKQCSKAQSDRAASHVVRVSSVEKETSVRKSSPKESISLCEIAIPTTRRKRSVRVWCSGNVPGNDLFQETNIPLPTLLSNDIREDEVKAVTGLLMISTGVGSWKDSDVGKNSSGLQIWNETVWYDLLLGDGCKRAQLSEVDDATPKMLKLPGYADSLSINSNAKGKVPSCDMICGGVEVGSFVTCGIVEEMRSLVIDVLEGEKIPELRSDDEVLGGNKKRILMLLDSDCTEGTLPFQRRGYRCKSCGRIFLIQLELGDHLATSRCSSTENKKVNGDCTSSPSHTNCPDTVLSFDGDDRSDREASASERERERERDHHGTLLPDLNVPVEVTEQENSIRPPELLG